MEDWACIRTFYSGNFNLHHLFLQHSWEPLKDLGTSRGSMTDCLPDLDTKLFTTCLQKTKQCCFYSICAKQACQYSKSPNHSQLFSISTLNHFPLPWLLKSAVGVSQKYTPNFICDINPFHVSLERSCFCLCELHINIWQLFATASCLWPHIWLHPEKICFILVILLCYMFSRSDFFHHCKGIFLEVSNYNCDWLSK